MKAATLAKKHGGIREARMALARLQSELTAMEDRRVVLGGEEGRDAMAEQFMNAIGHMPEERFAAMFFSQGGEQLGPMVIYEGGTTCKTILYPRNLFRDALMRDATGMVICHNHPGGNQEPSGMDRDLTHKVEKMGESLNVTLIDHVIVTKNQFTSFKRRGYM